MALSPDEIDALADAHIQAARPGPKFLTPEQIDNFDLTPSPRILRPSNRIPTIADVTRGGPPLSIPEGGDVGEQLGEIAGDVLWNRPALQLLPKLDEKSVIEAARQFTGASIPTMGAAEQLPKGETSKIAGAATGYVNSVNNSLNWFTTPQGIMTGAVSGLPAWMQRLVAAGFAYHMGKEVPKMATELGSELGKNPEDRDYEKIGGLTTDIMTSAGLAAATAAHAGKAGIAKDVPPIRDFLTKKVVQQYSPQEMRDLFSKVDSGTASQHEKDVYQFVTTELESPGKAFRKGVKITSEEPKVGSEFWRKYLGLDEGRRTLEVPETPIVSQAKPPIATQPAGPRLLLPEEIDNAVDTIVQQASVPSERGGVNEVGKATPEAGTRDLVPSPAVEPQGPVGPPVIQAGLPVGGPGPVPAPVVAPPQPAATPVQPAAPGPIAQVPPGGGEVARRGTIKFQSYDEPTGSWQPRSHPVVISKSTIQGDKPWRATVFGGPSDSPVAIGHVQLDKPSDIGSLETRSELAEQLGRHVQNLTIGLDPSPKPSGRSLKPKGALKVGDQIRVVAGQMGLTADVTVKAINSDGTLHVNGKTNSGVVFDDQHFDPRGAVITKGETKPAKPETKLPQTETITPSEDTPIGVNDAGEKLYQRASGEVYRMRTDRKDRPNGYPDFGGDLAPKPETKAPVGETKWKGIGANDTGNHVYEDDRGVRSTFHGSVRVTEPVRLIPTRAPNGDIVYQTEAGNRDNTEFETVPEKEGRKPGVPVAKPEEKPTVTKGTENEPKPTPTSQLPGRPVGNEPPPVAPGQPTGLPPGGPGETRPATPPPESGGAVSKPGSRRGGKVGGSSSGGKRTGAGQPLPNTEPAGGPPAPERPRLEKGAEVSSGPDVVPQQNLRIQPADELSPKGRTARIQSNLKAITLSKLVASENRLPTPDEKRIIMQFSGWGDTFQVFGIVPITSYTTAADIYERERTGEKLYNIIYTTPEQERFNKWKKQYGNAYDLLRSGLTEKEWQSAKESSLNAHYTSRTGIQALWKIARQLGWQGGTAVETSAGIGHIIGLTPNDYAGRIHWIGVELDKMTGQMLAQLYPASDIQVTGFEKSLRTQNNSADLVMSNFPFGNFDVLDPKHPDYDGWSIHNYFTARSIDVIKPGGLVIAITSRYTLDSAKGKEMRDWLASRADFVGAIRLPNTAFKENAGTEVVTDIIVFQKKSGLGSLAGERFTALGTVDIDPSQRAVQGEKESDADYQKRKDKPVLINEYFLAHPEMVLGTHSLKGSMFAGDTYTVNPISGAALEQQLDAAMSLLPKNISRADEAVAQASEEASEVQTVSNQKPGRYLVKDGKVWQVDDQGRLNPPDFGKQAATIAAAKKLIELRDTQTDLIRMETDESAEDAAIETQRAKLNEFYDKFVLVHGAINSRKNAAIIEDDPEFPLLASLEDEVRTPNEVTIRGKKLVQYQLAYVKGPQLLRRVNFPRTEPVRADNLADAVSISINYRGGISPDYIGKLIGEQPDRARQMVIDGQLAFDNPDTGLLDSPDLYLSGFVKLKLASARRAAEQDPKYSPNVAALEQVQPKDLPAEQIYFKLGSNWIDHDMVHRFLRDVLDVDCEVTFIRAGDETRWMVGDPDQESTANGKTFSGGGVLGHALVEDCLNLKLTERSMEVENENGNTVTVKLPEETAAARDAQNRIQTAFREWALKNPTEAQEIEKRYNELFNGMVRRDYPVPKFDRFPGASDMIKLRDWQKRAAVRSIQEATLLAHSVGTGKTYTLITAAMEMRRLGTAHKPVIVVQNSTLTQFANSFRRLYPMANILVGNSKQTAAEKRKGFVAKIATRDWDAVVIPVSFFERIENDPQREADYVQEQLDNLEAMIVEAEGKNYDPNKKPKSTLGKQLLKVKRRFENKMLRVLDRLKNKRDDLITFEQLGADALLVDEAHHFKRGDFMTKMDRVKGLDTNGSDRSMDFYLKTQFIHSKSPDRNVILATGTPISNTLAEMWTMLRYIRPTLLKKFNVETFDDFVGTFATTEASIEETPTGGFSQVLRLAKYVNGPEIGQFWRAASDVYVLNRDDFQNLGINVPQVKGGAPTEVVLEPSGSILNFTSFLRDWRLWWENLEGKEKAALSYVPILQYGLARKAAIDMRLVNPNWADDPASKTNRVVADVFKMWQETADITGTQLVFSNLYRSHDPKKKWLSEEDHLPNPLYGKPVFDVFQDMKEKLVKLGVPASEIANFTGMTEPQRFATAEQVKEGKIRIAFGTTESLGTGLNVQDHITRIAHVDPQFRPMDFEQRNGRGIRQGNQNPEIEILAYGVKRTMDSTLYQLMLRKQKFIAQMMTADNLSREFEDPSDDATMSFQAMSAAFSGNPLFSQRFGLENDVRRLQILEEDFDRRKSDTRNQLRDVREGLPNFENNVKVMLLAKTALESAFSGQEIKTLETKNGKFSGQEAKDQLDGLFSKSFGDMEASLNTAFADGSLAESRKDDIAKYKKKGWYSGSDITRSRSGKIVINGVAFDFNLHVTADFRSLADGALNITGHSGRWDIPGLSTADWSDEKPWYSSQGSIYGHASSGGTFASSLWHCVKQFQVRADRVDAARKRFVKVDRDLVLELEKPFESANRLVEQRQKLSEVLAALEASGAATAAVQAPTMEQISSRHPTMAYITRQVAAEGSADLVEQFQKEENEKAKKQYFRRIGDKWDPVKKAQPLKVQGFEWVDLFLVHDKKEELWSVIETTTGVRIGSGKTQDDAKKHAEDALKNFGEPKMRAIISKVQIDKGISPRTAAIDSADRALVSKFQTGKLVLYDYDNQPYLGVVREIDPGKAMLAVEMDGGGKMLVPMRLATPASGKQQADYDALKTRREANPPEGAKPQSSLRQEGVATPIPGELARGPVVLRSIEELRAAVNSPDSGLPKEAVTLINEFLKLPKAEALEGMVFTISDVMENGFQGSKLLDDIEFVRSASPETPVHEFLHRVWDYESPEIRNETERLRVETLNELIKEAQSQGANIRAAALIDVRDNPIHGGADFLKRNYPFVMRRELYPLASPEEFYAGMGSKHFQKKVGSKVPGFWDRVKQFIRDIVAAFRKLFKAKQSRDQFFDKVLKGEFKPVIDAEVVNREAQGSLTPTPPGGEPKDLFPVEQPERTPGPLLSDIELQDEIANALADEGVTTSVFGRKDTVLGREHIGPVEQASGAAHAAATFAKAGIQVQMMPDGFWALTDDFTDQEVEGHRLLDDLTIQLQTGRQQKADTGYLGNLLRSVVVHMTGDNNQAFSQGLKDELYAVAHGEESHRGVMLAALKGFKKSVEYIARNVDVILKGQYSDSFGGEFVRKVTKQIATEFRDYLTDYVKEHLESQAALQDMLDLVARLEREHGGGAVYRKVQALLRPKKAKKLARLEADARVTEAVNEILEQAKALGFEPVKRPGKPLSPLRQLMHMVNPKTQERIQGLVEKAIGDAERTAGIKAALKAAGSDVEREDLQGRFAAGEEPTLDQVESGLNTPEFEHWKEVRDNLLGYDPVTIKLVETLLRSDFRGTKFNQVEKVADTRIDLEKLAKQPDAEVARVVEAYLDNLDNAMEVGQASPETKLRVEQMVEQKVAEQLEAARARVREPLFAPPKAKGTPLTPEQRIGQLINAGLFGDPRLNIPAFVATVASKAPVRRLTPKAADLVARTLQTPFYRQGDMAENFANLVVEHLGISPEQADKAKEVFIKAMEAPMAKAREAAQKKAAASLTPRDRSIIKTTKPLWQKLVENANVGNFDSGDILRQIAQKAGGYWWSEAAMKRMRDLSEKLQRLNELTPQELVEAGTDPVAITAKLEEKQAFNREDSIRLRHEIGTLWARLTKPLTYKTAEGKENIARSTREIVCAKMLLKITHPPRMFIEVITQGAMYTPTRAAAAAWERWQNDKDVVGRDANLARELAAALIDAYKTRIGAFLPMLASFRQAVAGSPEARNVDRIMSSVSAFERMAQVAQEKMAAGKYVQAVVLLTIKQMDLSYRIMQAMDNIQRIPAEYQEMRQLVVTALRENGMDRATAFAAADDVVGDIKAEWRLAYARAGELLDLYGIEKTGKELRARAQDLLRARVVQKIRAVGLPADDFAAQADNTGRTISWTMRARGPGGVLADVLEAANRGLGRLGEPIPLFPFSNAIATGMNRTLTWSGMGFFPGMFKGDPFYSSPQDVKQRKIEAAIGMPVSMLIFACIMAGLLVYTGNGPRDPREREIWRKQGHRENTLEVPHDDGTFDAYSSILGALASIRPSMAMAGAIVDLQTERGKAQQKLNDEAEKLGLVPGKIRPIDSIDIAGIAIQAGWASLLGSRTAVGMTGSMTSDGQLNVAKSISSFLTRAVPLPLEGYQELTRMAGIQMDPKLAGVFDFMIPTGASGARKLNMLGDPVGTQDDLQRIVQIFTLGTYPGIDPRKGTDAAAYAALLSSGYRPQEISPATGYALGGEYRPMNNQELGTYAKQRGELFKQELAGLGPEPDRKEVQAAFARANQAALDRVGVDTGAKAATEEAVRPVLPAVPSAKFVPPGAPTALRMGLRSRGMRSLRGGRRIGISRPARARGVRMSSLRSGIRTLPKRNLGSAPKSGLRSLRQRRV